jgi:hypothetical protein
MSSTNDTHSPIEVMESDLALHDHQRAVLEL